jgi:ankyrin repeat protein
MTALHYAVLCENVEMITLLITNGADPNLRDFSGESPMEACPEKLKVWMI